MAAAASNFPTSYDPSNYWGMGALNPALPTYNPQNSPNGPMVANYEANGGPPLMGAAPYANTPLNYVNNLNPNDPSVPLNPGYTGLVDANGALLPQFQLQGAGALLPQFQDQMKSSNDLLSFMGKTATSTDASPWAQVAQLSNKANTANQMGAAGAQANSGTAAAASALAGHGGLRQGAMQNIANQGQKSLLAAKQGVLNQSNLNDLSIQGQDATNKMTMMNQAVSGGQNAANLWGQMAGADRTYDTGVKQQNINSLIGNNQGQNSFNQNTYNTNMNAWAANQQSQADADAAKHSGGLFGGGGFMGLGSWICTEVNALSPLSADIIDELKKLRRASLKEAPGRASFYLNGAGGLLGQLKATGYDFGKERAFVIATAMLHKVDPKAAVEAYWDRVNELLKEHSF